jgi:putative ABC transport system permease protein
MYILQNALKNLMRNKGRNIMIGAIIFAIVLTTVVALIINNTASAVIEDYKDRFSSEISITPNMQRVQEEAMKNTKDGLVAIRLPELSSEMYLQFADSEYLQKSILNGTMSADCSDIRAIDQSDEDDTESGNTGPGGGPVMPSGGNAIMGMKIGGEGNFKLLGDSWQEFTDGTRDLASGEFPQNDYECLISKDLQNENNIQIGDTISFSANISMAYEPDEYPEIEIGDTITVNGIEYTTEVAFMGGRATREAVYELTVVGIYDDLNDEYLYENMPQTAGLNRRNEVLTTLPSLLADRNTDEGGIMISATYFLKSPEMLADFEAEVRAKGLPATFDVGADTDSYNNIVKPVLGLKKISITFMIVVMVLGSIILLLLASISIRERKYEIGVLRAMGMKKAKVALGLWLEILAITCICLVIGLGAGVLAAQPISDTLLKEQVAAAESASPQGPGGMVTNGPGGAMTRMGPGGMMSGSFSDAKPLSEMKITLNLITVLEIIMISLLLASLAGLIAISRITKYEPIKILMERN